ncbi:MAG TPA: FAD-binding protein [Bryobacteraceae bacterium]|nr:FAD-binding protein [Bryobacteraceae bacterium]
MNRRAWLKSLAGFFVSAAAPFRAAGAQKLTNWAGNLTYSTDRVLEASSVARVQSAVRSLDKVKALGTRHCFNSIADSRDNLLSLKPMAEVVDLDPAKRTVTVDAGITYGKLCPYLDRRGFALHNLASLPHISIAGACSTATHGSGENNGNLATAVTALEMVNAHGDVVRLSRATDGDLFQGAVVGLGALGVITRLTLRIQPTYAVRQYVYENMPLAQMKDHFDQIQASGYSVSLFTDWQKQRINEVWIKTRTDSAGSFSGPAEFFGAAAARRNLHPIAELSAENCTEQMGVPGPWYDRLPHFRMGFTPSAGKELQSEYFVPRRNAVDAILAVERLRDQITPRLLISEIRTIAADDLWMSTCYQRPSVTIHFTWKPDWPAVQRVLPLIERELGPYKPRPHWGKLFTMPPGELRSRYPRLPDFVALASKYDPAGKLRNDFLNRNIFAS